MLKNNRILLPHCRVTWATVTSHLLRLIRKDPKAFPGQPRDMAPPAPGSSSRSPPGGTYPELLSRETSRRRPKQMPKLPQLSPSRCGGAATLFQTLLG